MRIIKVPREDGSFDLEFGWDGGDGTDYLFAGGGSELGEPGYEGRTAAGLGNLPPLGWFPNPAKGNGLYAPIQRFSLTLENGVEVEVTGYPDLASALEAAKKYEENLNTVRFLTASPTVAPPANGLGAATTPPAGRAQPSPASLGESRPAPTASRPVPDWTTQTEWAFTRPDPRLIQPVTSVDTGNRPLNVLVNKVLLPWRNALAFVENIPLAALIGTDDALKHSPVQVEYQAAQDLLPLEGAALEVAPALEYAATRLSTSQHLGATFIPTLAPELKTSVPSLEQLAPSLAEEANTRFLEHVEDAQQFFAQDPSRILDYGGSSRLSTGLPVPVSPGQLAAASRRLSFAEVLAGNAIESRVFETILTHPEDYQLFDQLSGAGRIDFVGIGRFEGLTFELTSEAGVAAHSIRPYLQRPGAFIFTYPSFLRW